MRQVAHKTTKRNSKVSLAVCAGHKTRGEARMSAFKFEMLSTFQGQYCDKANIVANK